MNTLLLLLLAFPPLISTSEPIAEESPLVTDCASEGNCPPYEPPTLDPHTPPAPVLTAPEDPSECPYIIEEEPTTSGPDGEVEEPLSPTLEADTIQEDDPPDYYEPEETPSDEEEPQEKYTAPAQAPIPPPQPGEPKLRRLGQPIE